MKYEANLSPAHDSSRDEVRRRRRRFGIAAHALLELAVGDGQAIVLAQMLEPGLDAESLDEAAGDRRVLEESPRIASAAPALSLQRRASGEEGLAMLGCDPVFHRHHHRALIVLDRPRHDR